MGEDRRVKTLVAKHQIADADRKVSELRQAIMAAKTPAPMIEKPKVARINTDMPFSDKPVNDAKGLHPLQARLRANMERNLAAAKAAG